jgi:quinol monooxygenase YgiN
LFAVGSARPRESGRSGKAPSLGTSAQSGAELRVRQKKIAAAIRFHCLLRLGCIGRVLRPPAAMSALRQGVFHMAVTNKVDANVVTLINVLTVEPANQASLLALLRDNTENTISKLEGWIATNLIASRDKRRVVICSRWKALANVEAMRTDPRMVAYFPRLAALASFDSIVGDVVLSHSH